MYSYTIGMVVEKLNVLHWHAVDDQSFPLELQSLPRLAPAARFGPKHSYSVENITALVAYAKSRGVRIMIEVDTPGHCQVVVKAVVKVVLLVVKVVVKVVVLVMKVVVLVVKVVVLVVKVVGSMHCKGTYGTLCIPPPFTVH
jgi:hypothetical protein